MKNFHTALFFALMVAIVLIIPIILNEIYDVWSLLILTTMILLLGIMFLQFERGKISSKELSLIAIISGVSTISRIPFAAIPSVQPCTYLIICTGYVFGPLAGFMVGAITAFISNIFLGQGPWTFFQMFAWGMIGITSSLLSKLKIKTTGLIIFGVIWGYLFGWIVNLWFWIGYVYPHNFSTLIFTMSTSIGFDTLHAIGNAIFLLLLGEKTIKIFTRYKNRFHIEYKSHEKSMLKEKPVFNNPSNS